MSLDKPRQSRQSMPGQAIDGFRAAPSRPLMRPAAMTRPPASNSVMPSSTGRRLIGDFSQPNGYHARRQLTAPVAANNRPLNRIGNVPPATRSVLASSRSSRPPLLDPNARSVGKASKYQRRRRTRRWALRTVTAVVVSGLLVGGFLAGKGYFQLHHIFQGGAPKVAALTVDVNPDKLNGEGDGRINILLLGIGGQNHDGPDLTDTMMVASIDPVNDKADLLSIPRDLWVKMPNNYIANYQKINTAYESGKYNYLGEDSSSNSNEQAITAGFATVDKTVGQVLGISMDYNVVVDFQAFQQAVNTVGGVTLNVPTELYDPTMAWQNNGNPILAEPGPQTMNGNQALLYVRSRETTSDFSRAQRQRALLLALKQKVLTLGTLSNPIKISNLISAFGDNVRTDLSLGDAEALYGIMKKINNSDITSVDLVTAPHDLVTTAQVDGLSVVEPLAGEFDYADIQSYVRTTLKDGYLAKENATVEVLNGTTVPGLATQEAATLQSYGYKIGTVGNTPAPTYERNELIDLTHGKDKYTKNYLQKRLGVTATTTLPQDVQPNGANFVIIVGQDEANNAAQ